MYSVGSFKNGIRDNHFHNLGRPSYISVILTLRIIPSTG